MQTSTKNSLNYSQRLRRLRYLSLGFLLFLLIPMSTILYFGFLQIENNILKEYQHEANNLIQIFDRKLYKNLTIANTLPVDEFDFYQQVYNPITKRNQQVISPLSSLKYLQPNAEQQIVGLIGFFQFNSEGRFNSPVWPESLSKHDLSFQNISDKKENEEEGSQQVLDPELVERKNAALKVYQILSQSKVIQKMVQGEFDNKDHYFSIAFDIPDYFIFYRVASFAEQSRLQGYLVERKPYLQQQVTDILEWRSFKSPVLVRLQDVKYPDKTEHFLYENESDSQTKVSQPSKIDNSVEKQAIHSTRLQWPYGDYAISLTTHSLAMTPALLYNGVFVLTLITAILFSCYGFYRLGVKQLILGEQRLNFVSSVSHELKTPLTSIQMYSQMLKEGTVISEAHQKKYFDFIYGESERLTRLINNILQLSTLSHQQQNVRPEYTKLSVLQDIIRSKKPSIIDKNGFHQNIIMEITNGDDMLVFVEEDSFSQIIINITDNTVKFFDQEKINDSSRKRIDFIFRQHPVNASLVQLEVRDYGEGITPEQQSKIFELFYRGGNELTRATQGTGIGLALVYELVLAQQGEVKVERKEPGLSILLTFQCKLATTS